MAQMKFTFDVDKRYSKEERTVIAQKAIDYIVKRTVEKNVDKDGKRLPGYSKSYINSVDFKIGGKSSSKVNLTLSGDMLAELGQYINVDRAGKVTIGYNDGSEENAKAEGNIKGTYGQKTPIPGKKRDFLGIKESDLKSKILSQLPLEGRKADEKRAIALEEFKQLDITAKEIRGLFTLQELENENQGN